MKITLTLQNRLGNFSSKGQKIKKLESTMEDSIVKSVIEKYKQRSEAGITKYGVTLDRKDLTIEDWITHAQEEAMDLSLYLERIKQEIDILKENDTKSKSKGIS